MFREFLPLATRIGVFFLLSLTAQQTHGVKESILAVVYLLSFDVKYDIDVLSVHLYIGNKMIRW